jgi:hypothetical protein
MDEATEEIVPSNPEGHINVRPGSSGQLVFVDEAPE